MVVLAPHVHDVPAVILLPQFKSAADNGTRLMGRYTPQKKAAGQRIHLDAVAMFANKGPLKFPRRVLRSEDWSAKTGH